jgi:hypothetical protein
MSLRYVLNYFFPRHKLPTLPSHYISEYDIKRASKDEKLMMMAGHARSPEQARLLMKAEGVDSAGAYLRIHPPKNPHRVSWYRRFVSMVMRAEGAMYVNPYRKVNKPSRVPIKFRFKE